MIRVATIEDHQTVYDMALKFAKATKYAKFVDDATLWALVGSLVANPDAVVFLDEAALLIASKNKFMLSNDLIATEICWWVEPEARKNGVGKLLINEYEAWAKEQGCQMMTLCCLDDLVGKFYEKMGYEQYEWSYFKEV